MKIHSIHSITLCTFFLTFLITSFYVRETFCQDIPDRLPEPDTAKHIIVNRIILDGNKQTRPSIILREMRIHENDTVVTGDLNQLLRTSRENIFNTRLFNFVTIDTTCIPGEPDRTDIRVHVIERWYIWPWPYFEFSDRNFNTWLETMDFSRLTYGINLTVFNVRGRNETLTIPIHFGYNQKYGFNYQTPYVNRKQTIGFGFGAEYSRNHEVIVTSVDNKTVYYKDPGGYPFQQVYSYLQMQLRPSIYSKHIFQVSYSDYFFSDSLATIPGYSPDSLQHVQFLSLYYQFRIDHRDEHFYPLKGYYADLTFTYNGLFSKPVNVPFLELTARKYWQLFNRWYFATGLFAKVSLNLDQPYFLERGLGYGRTYVRGYEYYVVDGQHFALLKNNLKFAILPKRVFVLNSLKSQKFNTIPIAFYMNVFTDLGYVYNDCPHSNTLNSLQNSLLVGYGVGFDFTTYYDLVMRIEFSMNGLGRPGIYLHFMAPI